MSIERFDLMAVAMFVISVIVSERWMTLTLTFRMGKVNYKYASRKVTDDMLFDGNSSVCNICHRLRDGRA